MVFYVRNQLTEASVAFRFHLFHGHTLQDNVFGPIIKQAGYSVVPEVNQLHFWVEHTHTQARTHVCVDTHKYREQTCIHLSHINTMG